MKYKFNAWIIWNSINYSCWPDCRSK